MFHCSFIVDAFFKAIGGGDVSLLLRRVLQGTLHSPSAVAERDKSRENPRGAHLHARLPQRTGSRRASHVESVNRAKLGF